MNKTKKALTKRFKITGTGKILRRLSGQNHYRSKKTGEDRRKGRKWIEVSKAETSIHFRPLLLRAFQKGN
jgi:large subunit ribosomal protein L35